MNILAVPLRVDALIANKEESVVGAGADFSQLPYQNAQNLDINSDKAFIASSVARIAFNNLTHLAPGVHLHWAIPNAMTKGEVDDDGMKLPTVPNRWLVYRINNKTGEQKNWIVESDYLYPTTATPQRAICIPNKKQSSNHQPYRYMGRQLTLDLWLQKQGQQQNTDNEYLANLSALGWGTPYFSSLYGECFSVFGAYDPDINEQSAADHSYQVYGWYSDAKDDFVPQQLLDEKLSLSAMAAEEADWTLPENAEADTLLCYGRVDFQPDLSLDDNINLQDTQLCLAKTSSEAIATYLSKNIGPTPTDALRIENQLQAALFAEALSGENIDFVNQLKLARHKEGFSPITAGKLWIFCDFANLVNSAVLDDEQKTLFKTAYAEYQSQNQAGLTKLNQLQSEFDSSEIELNDLRSRLYADWSKYMLSQYSATVQSDVDIDSDLIRHMIEHSTMVRLEALQKYVEQLKPLISSQKDALKTTFDQSCAPLDLPDKTIARECLMEIPDSRYWRADEPSLLVAGEVAKRSVRLGVEGKLDCQIIETSQRSMIDWLLTSNRLEAINWQACAINEWHNQPWDPLCIEWMLDVHSEVGSQNSMNANQKNYDVKHITSNYRIPLNDDEFSLPGSSVDFSLKNTQSLNYEDNPNVVTGRSLLTFSVKSLVDDKFQGAIENYQEQNSSEDAEQALDDPTSALATVTNAKILLQSSNCLTQRLDGFHNELLMNSNLSALRVFDPIQYQRSDSGEKTFTQRVNALLKDQFFRMPSMGHQFTPIKSGITKLGKVRIIDAFGRYKDLDCDETLRPQRELIGSAVFSAPRVLQPLRLAFRWREHPYQTNKQTNDQTSQINTPICGWICYNLFDESLVFYDSSGQAVGQINTDGEWVTERGLLQSLNGVVNAPFKRFIRKMLSFHNRNRLVKSKIDNELWQTLLQHNILREDLKEDRASLEPMGADDWPADIGISYQDAQTLFISARAEANHWPKLKQVIRRGQDNIEPNFNQSDNDSGVLRPLAVVQADLDLQLYGDPQINKSWSALSQDIYSGQRSGRGFTDVKFPIKLGEFRNLDDALVGYWQQDDDGTLSRKGSFPQSDADDIPGWIDAANFDPDEHDYVDAVSQEGVANIQLSFNDPARHILMLLDPQGVVHATSGIAPKKTLSLSPSLYNDALEKLQVSYFAAPLMTPKGQLSLPLSGRKIWRWEQRKPNGEVDADPSVQVTDKTQFMALGGQQDDWVMLIENGVLQPVSDVPELAYYISVDPETLSTAVANRLESLQDILKQCTSSGITKPQNVAALSHQFELVEGWLRPMPEPTNIQED